MKNKNINKKMMRCVIYTRKSTNQGLDQEFSSLDAQREACENYIRSQKAVGWVLMPKRYDDGGFTGGNIERPALRELLEDIQNKRVDIVLVYKVDRFSRSLLDFARLMQLFEEHQVGLVSVTQNFDSTTSMGRLTLNMLLSFAQFEREMISERTKDKLSALRKKGRWLGCKAPLGYDTVGKSTRLEINQAEAGIVRAVFKLYLETKSTHKTAHRLRELGYKTKRYKFKDGFRGNNDFTATSVLAILRNYAYTGKVLYENQVYEGEHEAIVEVETFEQVQEILDLNRREKTLHTRTSGSHLLKGLLRCGHCQCAISTSYCIKQQKRYHFYRCHANVKHHDTSCPNKNISAPGIEEEVIRLFKRIISENINSEEIAKKNLACILQSVMAVWGELHSRARSEFLRSILHTVTYDSVHKQMELNFNEDEVQRIAVSMGFMQEAA